MVRLTRKRKNDILDYAIERINQYDEMLEFDTAIEALIYPTMPECKACTLVDFKCSICPFNIIETEDVWYGDCACRPRDIRSIYDSSPLKHQKRLTKALKRWCLKFYPDYTVVRYRGVIK